MIQIICPDCGSARTVKYKTDSVRCRSCAKKFSMKHGLINSSPKRCAFCGATFVPNSNRQIYCTKKHIRICPICQKEYIEDNVENLKRPPIACSYECRAKQTEITSLQRYGCKAPGNNREACFKREQTLLKKYGVKYAMQSPKIKAKAQKSMMQKYGVNNAAKVPELLEKRMASLERHWRENGPISDINRRFVDTLASVHVSAELEFRIRTEFYDIHLIDTDTLIEIDPTNTHSTAFSPWGSPLDKYHHRDKTKLAEENGYRCIHVFDWDDWDKITNLIKPIERRVYARHCTIYKLHKSVGDEFLNKYHIQGSCRGQLLYLGLVHDGELLQVMTFGKSRYDKSYDVELLRLCTLPGVTVVGGASKLFSYVTKQLEVNNIISYCDRAKFTGTVYEKIGMKQVRITPPQEIWSKDAQHITANLLRSHGYDQLFGTNHGKGTSNEQLMLEAGWLPVYDCGQIVFEFR